MAEQERAETMNKNVPERLWLDERAFYIVGPTNPKDVGTYYVPESRLAAAEAAVWRKAVDVVSAVHNANELDDGGYFEAGFIASKTKIIDALLDNEPATSPLAEMLAEARREGYQEGRESRLDASPTEADELQRQTQDAVRLGQLLTETREALRVAEGRATEAGVRRAAEKQWATRPSASDYVILEGPSETILAFLDEANARQLVKRHNAALAAIIQSEMGVVAQPSAERELRAELKATQGLLNIKEAFWESAEKEISELKEALIWCSGSPDFAPEGQAREGWLKICAPLLAVPAIPSGEARVVPLPLHHALHVLWTKAVGQADYDKAEWRELETTIYRALLSAPSPAASVEYSPCGHDARFIENGRCTARLDFDNVASGICNRPAASAAPVAVEAEDDAISRATAMAAMCPKCTNPERYGPPAKVIADCDRLFHIQKSDGWNAGPCAAASIAALPAAVGEQNEQKEEG